MRRFTTLLDTTTITSTAKLCTLSDDMATYKMLSFYCLATLSNNVKYLSIHDYSPYSILHGANNKVLDSTYHNASYAYTLYSSAFTNTSITLLCGGVGISNYTITITGIK